MRASAQPLASAAVASRRLSIGFTVATMAAITAVLNGESGTIINEHYSLNEYINRRVGFLGRHPDYAHMVTRLFAIVRRDAADVFKQGRELSVQEVRRRESKLDVTPLLPLPTTDNCASVDNFRNYPDREWTPGHVPPVNRIHVVDKDDDNGHIYRLMSFTDAVAEYTTVAPATHARANMAPQTRFSQPAISWGSSRCSASPQPTAALQHDQGMHVASIEDSQDLLSRAANSQQTAQSSRQSAASPYADCVDYDRSSDAATATPKLVNRASTSTATPEPATTTQDMLIETNLTPATSTCHDVEGAGQTTPLTGLSSGRPDPRVSSNHSRSSQASAPAGRGMSIPVKTKPYVKRARSESPAPVDSVIGDSPQPRPSKRPRLHAGPPPAAKALDDTLRVVGQAPTARSKRKIVRAATANEDGRSGRHSHIQSGGASKSMWAQAVHPDNDHVEAVAAGTALPRAKREAEAASKLRYNRLLERHQAAALRKAKKNQKNVQGALKNHTHPDLMPEFFDIRNFPEDERDSTVRCVCMVVHDDGTNMISCGECLVWQHPVCMGEGVPKNQQKGKYSCHVCDPWRHRKRLAELRQAQPSLA